MAIEKFKQPMRTAKRLNIRIYISFICVPDRNAINDLSKKHILRGGGQYVDTNKEETRKHSFKKTVTEARYSADARL